MPLSQFVRFCKGNSILLQCSEPMEWNNLQDEMEIEFPNMQEKTLHIGYII